MGAFDISGSGYDLNATNVFSNALSSPDPAASPSGVFDYLERGGDLASRLFGTYLSLTGKAPQSGGYYSPERTVEYDVIPRDIAGGSVSGRGVSVSWQLVALAGLAAFAYLALKKA